MWICSVINNFFSQVCILVRKFWDISLIFSFQICVNPLWMLPQSIDDLPHRYIGRSGITFIDLLTYICHFDNENTFANTLEDVAKKLFSSVKGKANVHSYTNGSNFYSITYRRYTCRTIRYQEIGHFININALLIYCTVLCIIYGIWIQILKIYFKMFFFLYK